MQGHLKIPENVFIIYIMDIFVISLYFLSDYHYKIYGLMQQRLHCIKPLTMELCLFCIKLFN